LLNTACLRRTITTAHHQQVINTRSIDKQQHDPAYQQSQLLLMCININSLNPYWAHILKAFFVFFMKKAHLKWVTE